MLIDWFTIIAQVVNFLVLIWLLKRFLYRPILDAIDAREQRIAAELTSAQATKNEAAQQYQEFQYKNEQFEQQNAARMKQLDAQAKAERVRLLDEVRAESQALRRKLQLVLKNEQLSLQQALSCRVRKEVFATVRKVLVDLAGTSLEERMTAIFINRLHAINEQEMAELKSALYSSAQPLLVRTAFTLSTEQCTLIEMAMKEILGDDVVLSFVTQPDLVCGIEINANGQKIAWSIADYLSTLTKSVEQVLQEIGSDIDNINDASKEQQ